MTTTNSAPASRRRLWIAIGALAALIVVLIVVVFAIGTKDNAPSADSSTGASEAPAVAASSFQPADLVDCRLSLTTPQGIDEGGKALSTREGPDGFEVDTQWGWFDENGVAHTDSDPSYQPESYATHRWVTEADIRGFTCDGGTSWTWLKKQ